MPIPERAGDAVAHVMAELARRNGRHTISMQTNDHREHSVLFIEPEDAIEVSLDGTPVMGLIVEDGALNVVRWDTNGEVVDHWRIDADPDGIAAS